MKAFELIEITANADNVKKEYFLGESFNPEGLTLTVTCSDGSDDPITKTIMEGFTCTVEDTDSDVFDKKGEEIRVTISYQQKTADFKVTVKSAVKEIAIGDMPKKTEYIVGETFDPTGLTLNVTCDGESDVETIDTGFEWDPKSFALNGDKIEVTIRYAGKTTTLVVKVNKNPMSIN